MAYAAVISLKNTIVRLLNSTHISIVQNSSSQAISRLLYQVACLDELVEELNNKIDKKTKTDNRISLKKLDDFDGRTKDAIHQVEDVIETRLSNEFLARFGEGHPSSLLLDLQEWREDLDSLTREVKKTTEHIKELINLYPDEDEDEDDDDDEGADADEDEDEDEDEDDENEANHYYFDDDDDGDGDGDDGNKSKVIGLSNVVSAVRDQLTDPYTLTNPNLIGHGIISLYGMAGIGKTTLAKEIMKDPLIRKHFKCRFLIKVGPKCKLKKFMRQMELLLHEVDPEDGTSMYEGLTSHRFLIVLDDVWNLDTLRCFMKMLPFLGYGKRILVTTRIQKVAAPAGDTGAYRIPFLNREQSWDLLREEVFGQNTCPRKLEKAGRKIAENCAGLPLTIITVARILLSETEKIKAEEAKAEEIKAEEIAEFWNEVAAKKNSVFFDAYEEMSKVLLPSYNYLPQHLKPCFLYLGILPENDSISRSKLVNLWSCEGFLQANSMPGDFEGFVVECLEGLVSRNVVIIHEKIALTPSLFDCNNQKYCLHPAFLHLCIREAQKTKFLHVVNHYVEDAERILGRQRRLCVQYNELFSYKDLHDSMTSVSTVRSLLCTGSYHPYPVPTCFGLMLLRVLDALTVRFYEFPVEVLKLIQLRYFAMTCDGKLPASISRLWNLECLMVERHTSIVQSSGIPSYLPFEIWDMQELKHLQVTGSDLPDPDGQSFLPNLLTLLGVSAHGCTERVLERIPNLKRLGIQIEMTPDNVEPLSCFDHLSHLYELEILKCVLVNPVFTSEFVTRPTPLPIFPHLRRLSLSGLGYPWEEIRAIASLPSLIVLKLGCYAFRGPECETCEGDFPALEYLSIRDCDLVVWIIGDKSFDFLRHLIIKHCYNLEEIRGDLGRVQKVEVVDCSPLAVKQISHLGHVHVRSSWEDGK